MGLLKLFSILLIITFPIAEVGRIQFANGVAISLNDILLGILIAVWVIYLLRRKKKIQKGVLFKPLVVFSAVALICLILNFSNLGLSKFLISGLYLVRFVCYASLYFVFKEFDAKFKQKVSLMLLFAGLLVVFLGFVQYFFYPSLRNLYYLGWDEHLYRLFSSFLDPNFVGAFLAMFFLFSLSFIPRILNKKPSLKFLPTIGVSVLILGALYLTYSRSALIMLVVGLVAYLSLTNKKRLIAISVIGLILLVFLVPKSFQTEGTNFLRIASSDARINAAGEAVKIFSKNPLYGVGFDAYRYAQHQQGLGGQYWQTSHGGAGTDNSFLFVLATTGVIGLLAFLYLLSKIFVLAFSNLKKSKFAVILLSSLLGLIVNSFFLNSLFYVFILEWVWILAALTESS